MNEKTWAIGVVFAGAFATGIGPAGAQGSTCLAFDTELTSLNLTGGPYAMPLASDPTNALGDSVDGYGFVNSQVTITLSSQRATAPGPDTLGLVQAFPGGNGGAGQACGLDMIDPDALDGTQFVVDSFFDVFFDITITDVDARPGRDFAGQPDGASIVLQNSGPASTRSLYQAIFDKNAPNFGLFPPPEGAPYDWLAGIEIPLGGDINGNGEDDKIKFAASALSASDTNRTFTLLPDGTVIDEFDSTADLTGTVVDLSTDPPFTLGSLSGPTTATSRLRNPVLGPPPVPANGFLSPTLVRAPLGGATGTLSVAATLDLGDKTVDFAAPASITYGGATLVLPGGFTPNSRRTLWSFVSPDGLTRVRIVPPNRRHGTSRARLSLVARSWGDLLPAFPGGVGEALSLGLDSGAFSVASDVQLVAGAVRHRANTQLADAPPLALDRVAGVLAGRNRPSVAVTASFAGDGVKPVTAPTVKLRMGEPGNTYDVAVPTSEHITTPTANGYQFLVPDPDGTGPLLPQGAWFVDVDYVQRRVRVHVRGEDFGTFPLGTSPFYFSLGLGGGENAVEVCANRRGQRLSYR